MKKFLALLLCICALTVPAFAVELSDFETIDENGNPSIDYNAYNAAVAAEKVAAAGLALDVDSYWVSSWLGITYFDNDAFEADYAAAMAALEPEPEPEPPAVTVDPPAVEQPTATEQPTESEVTNNETSPPVVADPDDGTGYPVGSFIDDGGNVWSANGELLSGETVAADDPGADDTGVTEEPAVYTINDMRSTDETTSILSGLKAMIVTIFGEYEPVTTTTAVTETVDNVTTTTLIDTVASGAAGVDYAWLAGVALFAILLYCVMRLFGGILK